VPVRVCLLGAGWLAAMLVLCPLRPCVECLTRTSTSKSGCSAPRHIRRISPLSRRGHTHTPVSCLSRSACLWPPRCPMRRSPLPIYGGCVSRILLPHSRPCCELQSACGRRFSSPLMHSCELLSFLQYMGAPFSWSFFHCWPSSDQERYHRSPTQSPEVFAPT
jgi:hypothetical protein